MTLGPLVAAAGVLWMSRIGADASYLIDVLPPVVVFGAGLALMVAPLTATVLDSAPDRCAGVASGINNAIARAAGLLSVAVIPVAAGLGGDDYTEPADFSAGFENAMTIAVVLLVAGAGVAAAFVRRPLAAAEPARGGARMRIEDCPHCGVSGPQLHPTSAGDHHP